MTTKQYYGAIGAKMNDRAWFGRVYHYDVTGNREIVDWQSSRTFETKAQAINAACEWCEENDVDAELE